jgi:hypothetical protein
VAKDLTSIPWPGLFYQLEPFKIQDQLDIKTTWESLSALIDNHPLAGLK